MFYHLRRISLSSTMGLALALASGAGVHAQSRFTTQYSFGDSLSDNGNLFAVSGGTLPPAPYAQGRFSNGPVFTELLGRTLVPHTTASTGQRVSLNFAYGGATAAPGSSVPHLAQQIALYRAQGLAPTRTDLFTVLAGANDIFPVFMAPATVANPTNLDTAATGAATAAASGVQALVSLGARNIVAAGMPNIGASPRALAAGSTGVSLGLRASDAYNREFRSRLATIAAATPDLNLVYVDLHAILDRTISEYRILGYNNATSYFLAPASAGGGAGDPNGYVFWDEIHPTAKTHVLLAAIVSEQLTPEIPLSFAATFGSAVLALEHAAAETVESRSRLLAGSTRPAGKLEAFAGFDYLDSNRTNLDFTGRVSTAGVDARASADFFIGGVVQASRVEAIPTADRGRYVISDNGGRLFALWRTGRLAIVVDAGYGMLRLHDLARRTSFGGLPVRGKTGGSRRSSDLSFLWQADAGGVSLSPSFAVRATRARFDAFTEQELPALAMSYEAQTSTSIRGTLGVDAAFRHSLGATKVGFDLRGAWHQELRDKTRAISGKLSDNFTLPATLRVKDGDGDGFELGGAISVPLARFLTATLGYAAYLQGGEGTTHRTSLSVHTGF